MQLAVDTNVDIARGEVCTKALHKFFRYDEERENILVISWIHKSSDIDRIHRAILESNEKHSKPVFGGTGDQGQLYPTYNERH